MIANYHIYELLMIFEVLHTLYHRMVFQNLPPPFNIYKRGYIDLKIVS